MNNTTWLLCDKVRVCVCVPIAQLKGEKCKLICFQFQSVYTNSEASVGQVFPIARPRRGSVSAEATETFSLTLLSRCADRQKRVEVVAGGGLLGGREGMGGGLENETATVHNAIYY